MQNNCEKSKAPFEVLIQGPGGSRFVRGLVAQDANAHEELVNPKNIATISVFQPNGNRKLAKRAANAEFDDAVEALAAGGNNFAIHFSHENPLHCYLVTYFFILNNIISQR